MSESGETAVPGTAAITTPSPIFEASTVPAPVPSQASPDLEVGEDVIALVTDRVLKAMASQPKIAAPVVAAPLAPPTSFAPVRLRTLDSVAIVGFAPHWNKAPFADKDWEIWCLNEFYDVAPTELGQTPGERVRWFEIHGRDTQYEGNPFFHSRNAPNEHAAKLARLGCPVYMQRHWDDIPNSVEYPLQAMLQLFGDYFTNSISYMIALAVAEGFKTIGVYGVDMAQDTEYESQRPSCEYFVGLARGRGCRVLLPDESDLCKSTFLYGFEHERQAKYVTKLKARDAELAQRLNFLRGQAEQVRDAINQIGGAQENTRYLRKAWNDFAIHR